MLIRGGKIVLPVRVIENGAVAIDETTGKIEAVASQDRMRKPRAGETVIDASDAVVAPGFVDIHCHGGWDADFMDGTLEAHETICAYNALRGVTSLLATNMSGDMGVILKSLDTTRAAMKRGTAGSEILGHHLEGPWLNPGQRGCHNEEDCRPPAPEVFKAVMEYAPFIRRVTVAPEIETGPDIVRELLAAGICVSIGHSLLTYDEMMPFVDMGVRHVTHIFSSMSTIIRKGPWRHPGILETAFVDDRITTELIADARHAPEPLMRLAYKCKGPDRLCLVSDSMRGAGMPEGGHYTVGPRDGIETVVANGVAMLPDMTAFASSITPVDTMVRNMVEMVGVPMEEALRMVTLTPARVVGVEGRKGSLEPGKDADVVILDRGLTVRQTIARGKILDRAALKKFSPAAALAC